MKISKTSLKTFTLLLVVYEITAFIASYVMNFKGASIDSDRFQEHARHWVVHGQLSFEVDAEFYSQLLGIFFYFFGSSEFLVTQTSIIAVLFSVYFINKISEEFFYIKIPTYFHLFLMLYPTMLSRCSTTMREPFMVCFFVMFFYYGMKYIDSKNIKYLLKSLLSILVAALFHKGFAVFFIVGFLGLIFLFSKSRLPFFKSKLFYMRLILITGGLGLISIFSNKLLNTKGLKPAASLVTGDAEYMERVIEYKSTRDFRTTYDAPLQFSSPLAFVGSIGKTFVYYMFMPFPHKVRNIFDLIVFVEVLLRFFALYYTFKYWRFIKSDERFKFLLFGLVMLSMIWAAGTSNYGTASRHHLTTNWGFFLILYIMLKISERNKTWEIKQELRKRLSMS